MTIKRIITLATKDNQSLVKLVKGLQKLNKVEAKLPKANIKSIIENPEQFALEFGDDVNGSGQWMPTTSTR